MGVYEKLAKIQKDLFVPKGQRNDFGKYNYRSCEDILQAVKPLCEANNCVLRLDSRVLDLGDRTYVVAWAILKDLEDGSEVSSNAYAREENEKKGMDASQISGSCLSYARKYALAGLFCIDNEKDSDATNKNDKAPSEDALKGARARTDVLKFLNTKSKEYVDNVLQRYKVAKVSDMSVEQCEDFLKNYKK